MCLQGPFSALEEGLLERCWQSRHPNTAAVIVLERCRIWTERLFLFTGGSSSEDKSEVKGFSEGVPIFRAFTLCLLAATGLPTPVPHFPFLP